MMDWFCLEEKVFLQACNRLRSAKYQEVNP